MRYEGHTTQAISFPLGGIGTGSIGLAGNGSLVDWDIKNRPDKCSKNGFSFFAVKAEKEGHILDMRILNGDHSTPYQGMPYKGLSLVPERCTMAGVPHFHKCVFDGSFPYARLEFEEEEFPGKAIMMAFNPMIPSNEDDSGIPAAFFEIEIQNDTSDDLDYIVAGVLQNPHDQGVNSEHASGKNCFLQLKSRNIDTESPEYGELCLGTDAADLSVQDYWFRGTWFDSLSVFWHDFAEQGLIKKRSYEEDGCTGLPDVGTITARLHVMAGQRKKVRFVISWYYPNFTNYWNPLSEEEKQAGLKNTWKNYYATKFESAADVADYALTNWNKLERDTNAFHDALFSTTLPEYAIDAVSSTMSVLKTATCVRLEDGNFYGWEGLYNTIGSCEGTCTHVWNYAYALPFLFPRLERSIRETNYRYNQDRLGGMHFRTQLPLGRKYSDFRPCADGQFGDVMKTFREWKICGDTEWLRRLWPAVKKSVQYAWNPDNPDQWDPNHDGVLEGRQHHTLDMELFGPSGWLNGFYLGALKAASQMAEAVGDSDFAVETAHAYLSGRKFVDEYVFNGEYYAQKIDIKDREALKLFDDAYDMYWNPEAGEIKYQIQDGCSIDQVTGQWHASLIGLGDILDPSHVRSALEAIYKYNFISMRNHFNPCRLYSLNDERGTVMCSWPKGRKKPIIPIPYAEETMYGFEYQAAVSMLLCGMTDQGMELIASIRARHNGENRNPWNEMECGSNYARSMSAYSILLAMSGFTYDMTQGMLGFKPVVSDYFKTFWSLDGAWGTYEIKGKHATLMLLYGRLNLEVLSCIDRKPKWVKLDGSDMAFEYNNGTIRFDNAEMKAGDRIELEI